MRTASFDPQPRHAQNARLDFKLEEVLWDCGHADRDCRRTAEWFMVWFDIARGLFCQNAYRRQGTLGRWRLYEGVVEWLGQPATPGAFYRGMRLTAIDGVDRLDALPIRSRRLISQAPVQRIFPQ